MKPIVNVAVAIALLLASGSVWAGELGNLSTRASVGTGDYVLIGGVIVTGDTPKRVMLRAIGGSLSLIGIPNAGVLQDPVLDLYDRGGNSVQTNDDWRYGPELEIEASGLSPSGDYDSAIVSTLAPGHHTAIIHGYAHSTGVALVEVYDLDPGSDSRLAEVSTRGNVKIGDEVLIGGFIVLNSATNMLLRAIGPELTPFGVVNALQNPTLELRDGNAALLEANDDWKSSNQQAISDTGLAPTDNRESAILRSVAPGNYTALVRGKDNTAGIALVEIYRLP